tara:strand:+ start:258 stop:392 length:135 start_codon:yes stop_codon:yes gene_type:complete
MWWVKSLLTNLMMLFFLTTLKNSVLLLGQGFIAKSDRVEQHQKL